jgi:hypothetical protein
LVLFLSTNSLLCLAIHSDRRVWWTYIMLFIVEKWQ